MCAPKPPNPKETAAAQTASNVDTAKAQAHLNNVNQVTPYGNLTYTAGNEVNGVPQYTATQTLSPVGQALFDANATTQQNLADLGSEQSGRLSGLLSEPFSLDNDATEARLMELGTKRLDPLLEKRRAQQEQSLADRGIRLGSDAYSDAQNDINAGENDAYNQLLLTGRNQAINEALMARNQPINEILSIASGTQLQNPSYANTAQTGVANTDVAGIANAAYQGELAGHKENMSALGSLFSAGGNLLMLSDDDAKKDKTKVGETDGMGVYTYRYKGENDDAPKRMGLMASEVQKVHPEAVTKGQDGLRRVDYGQALGAA